MKRTSKPSKIWVLGQFSIADHRADSSKSRRVGSDASIRIPLALRRVHRHRACDLMKITCLIGGDKSLARLGIVSI
jgi:hypothetical protein